MSFEATAIDLSEARGGRADRLRYFALLNLGLVQSLGSGATTAAEAVELLYHADNCLYVRRHLRSKDADTLMSHGVQLPDLFDSLPAEEASREFFHELETMRGLALKILDRWRASRVVGRASA